MTPITTAQFEWLALLLTAAALPLLSFVISILVKEKYSWLAPLISSLLMIGSFVLIIILLINLYNTPGSIIAIKWFSLHDFTFNANLHITRASLTMLAVVSFISTCVHIYSIGYMADDLNNKKYFAVLGFFTFAMYGIVLANNLFLLFCFWELVGFSSYLLIGHYQEKQEAALASKKAFIINRIADAGFIVGLLIIWANMSTFDLNVLIADPSPANWKTTASICIFIGIAGKSAQFPFFTWLPDAMAGPTPVSALIHAATMVAAGVYLLFQIYPLFTETSLLIVAVTGAFTSLLSASVALTQFDIKKILAYSTISQLGLMFIALGVKAPDAAYLHLITHAFFKAGLFLCAGNIIHSLHQSAHQHHQHIDAQDIRNMGGLRTKLPVTFIASIMCAAALAGVPLTSGFLSKDFILTSVSNYAGQLSSSLLVIVFIISFCTTAYITRLLYYVFITDAKTDVEIEESPAIMRLSVVILGSGSLWPLVSINPLNFSGWIINTSLHSYNIMIISMVVIIISFIITYFLLKKKIAFTSNLLSQGFYIDKITEGSVIKFTRYFSALSLKTDSRAFDRTIHFFVYGHVTLAHVLSWFDHYVIDGAVKVVAWISALIGKLFRSVQNGKIQHYIFWALLAIIIFIIWSIKTL